MLAILFITFLFLLAVLMIVQISRSRYYDDFDDEEIITTHTTTTTTTHDVPQYTIVGTLQRSFELNGQIYVIDPVDGEKMYLNSTDDMYQDGAGKIWKLS